MIYTNNVDIRLESIDALVNESVEFFDNFVSSDIVYEANLFEEFKQRAIRSVHILIDKIKALKDWIIEKITGFIKKTTSRFIHVDLKEMLRKAQASVVSTKSESVIIKEQLTKDELSDFLTEKIECVNYITMVKLMKAMTRYLQETTRSYDQPTPSITDLLYALTNKPIYSLEEFEDTYNKKAWHDYAFFIQHFSSLNTDINSILTDSFIKRCVSYYDGMIASLNTILERINKNVSNNVQSLKDLLTEYNNNEEEDKEAKTRSKLASYNAYLNALKSLFSMFLNAISTYNFHFVKCMGVLNKAKSA